MLKQIVMAGLLVSLLAGGGYFAWKCTKIQPYAWRMIYETYWAKFMVVTNPAVNHKNLTQVYTPPFKGLAYKRSCLSILNDRILQKTTKKVERYVELVGYKSLQMVLWSFLAVLVFWFVYGLAQKRKHHQRGATFAHWQQLKQLIRKNRDASRFKLKLKMWGRLPLLKNKETSHMLITGTTGSGKTNAFHILLPQIRRRKHRAIIVDVTGDYVSRYYNPDKDIILNPLDSRSQSWHPWADCHQDSHYDVLAESFIQTKEGMKDPFWDNAARAIFKTALRKFAFQEKKNIEELVSFLLSATDWEFEEFFKGTEAATYAVKNNEKTTSSIRSVLSSQIEGLRQLDFSETVFSIREWVMDEKTSGDHNVPEAVRKNSKGWLFITARADQRQTLKPLISAWLDVAINALMVLPENYDRRLWFIIDELAALQKLPRLHMGLAEARKYGGCILAGFQSKPQLEEIYGRNGAESMLDLFNTKLFFRCTEPSSQSWISKILGDMEEAEPSENISFGAHSTRDGVSLSRHTRQKPLVLPTELSQLKDLECYVKLPGDYPCTKLQMAYQKATAQKTEPFLLKPEKLRKYSSPLSLAAEVPETEMTCKKLEATSTKQTVTEMLQDIEIPEFPPENKEELI